MKADTSLSSSPHQGQNPFLPGQKERTPSEQQDFLKGIEARESCGAVGGSPSDSVEGVLRRPEKLTRALQELRDICLVKS